MGRLCPKCGSEMEQLFSSWSCHLCEVNKANRQRISRTKPKDPVKKDGPSEVGEWMYTFTYQAMESIKSSYGWFSNEEDLEKAVSNDLSSTRYLYRARRPRHWKLAITSSHNGANLYGFNPIYGSGPEEERVQVELIRKKPGRS